MTSPARRVETTLLALVLVLGAALRFWGLAFGLPHDFARPDEEKIIGAALGVFQGDPNPHFFLYPSLFIYATSAAFAALFAAARVIGTVADRSSFVAAAMADPSSLHLVARQLSAVAGVATIGALYPAGRELFGRRIALVAAALLSVVFLHVRDSHFGVTDVPVTLLVVCAFWAASRCATRGVTPGRMALAGLVCGLAASTKYNAALVAAPAFVAAAQHAWNRGREGASEAIGTVALFCGCLALGFLLGTPYAILDRPGFLAEFEIQRRTAMGIGHGSIISAAQDVVGQRGWIHHLTFSLPYGLGFPLLGAALAGASWLAAERSWRGALLLSFPAVFYAVMGSSMLVYPRWIVPIVPFLCLTAAVMVDRVADLVGRIPGIGAGADAARVLMVVLIAGPTAARSVAFDQLVSHIDTRVRAARWMEERFPGGATIYQTGWFYGFVEPRPRDRYRQYTFNDRHGVFLANDGPAAALPDLIVVLDSPLTVFSQAPRELDEILRASYLPIASFKSGADNAGSRPVYDQQDAFYVPFANLTSVTRPGPDISIFRRRSLTGERTDGPSIRGR